MSFISTVEKNGEKVVLYKYDGSDLQKDNDNMLEFGQQNQKKICFLDVETTGKDRSGDEIIEIAMKTMLYDLDSQSTSKIIEIYESYNEPTIPIKKEALGPLLSHNFSQEEAHLSFLLFYGYFIG